MKVKHLGSGVIYNCDLTSEQLEKKQSTEKETGKPTWVSVQEAPKEMILSYQSTLLEIVR